MPHRNLDACFYVEPDPEISFRNGVFHVGYHIGRDAYVEVALPPSVFIKAVQRANQLVAEFTGKCNVIPVEFESKFERRFKGEEKSA